MMSTPARTRWSDVVVVCGSRSFDGDRSATHHLASGLAAHVPVLYVDPIGSAVARDGTAGYELSMVDVQMARLSCRPRAGATWPGAGPIVGTIGRRALRSALGELGSPDVRAMIVSSLEPWFGVGERIRAFHATDDLLAGPTPARRSTPRLSRELRHNLAGVDLVIAPSPLLAQVFSGHGFETIVLPNGCDEDAFAPADVSGRRTVPATPVAGFIGELSSRIDLPALHAVADAGLHVLLIGRGPIGAMHPDLRSLLMRPNVEWIGPRASDAIPALAARVDVGLVPLLDAPDGRASLPLELLVHLAAGRPVVGTDCEPMRWLRSTPEATTLDLDEDLGIGGTPARVAELVESATRLDARPEAVERRRSFARHHRWSERCSDLIRCLEMGSAVPSPAQVGGGGRA